jgi:pimeloyl-ACP methyl ester carboxylesterase
VFLIYNIFLLNNYHMPMIPDINDPMVRIIDVDGRPTRCRIVRTKPEEQKQAPLTIFLLIHGIASSSEAWAPFLEYIRNTLQDQKLSKCNRFVGEILYLAPDMPGYGFTPLLEEEESPKNINQLADFCFRVLHRYNGNDVHIHVVGSSMGCQVAVAMARRWTLHNINICSTILCGPTVGGAKSLGRYWLDLICDTFLETFKYNITLMWMFWRQGIKNYVKTLKHMSVDLPLKNIPIYASSMESQQNERFIMIIRGEKDPIANSHTRSLFSDAILHTIQNEELDIDVDHVLRTEVIENVAHAMQFNSPATLVSIFADFMNETGRSVQ